MADLKELYDYVDAHAQEYIELLQKFCRQPSISAQNLGIREMVDMIQEEMHSIGVNPEIIETSGNPIIYAELPGKNSERTLSFYNHYDVQPAEPLEEWKSDPFGAEIRDGKMYARGATDNKGSLLSRLCAVKAYQAVYGKLPLNLKFIYEGEEEIGSPHLSEFAQKYPDRLKTDGFAWEGGSKQLNGPLEVCFGVKGLLYIELRCKTAASDLHSCNAAIVKNPAWRLVQALATMKDANDHVTIDGFYDSVKEPTQYEMDCLKTLQFREEETKERMGLDGFINDLTGIPLLKKLYYEPTANIAGFKAGYLGDGAKTIMPGQAVVKMDLRLVPDQKPEEILKLVREHLDRHGFTDIEVVPISGEPPFRADPECLFAKTVIKCVKPVYGMDPEVFVSSSGTTAMYQFCHEANLDAVMFGAGNEGSNIHAPNENIILEDYINAIKMAATVMEEFALAQEEK
ncbi:M20/M25/M40 family metallo-hydrolase [uncultured Ruthenibacterium sp.]|uniref:M20/M25/M40 family metallo-hydrolase n=1 Tax=uncultured Ruthenibacterium sp. TaxID=1905347 RepID=UPI00349EC213